jgi:hypothetical protein
MTMAFSVSALSVLCLVALLSNTGCAFQCSSGPSRFARHQGFPVYMASPEYDLAVVGGGIVGVQAALAAASSPLNMKVCLIDAPRASGMLMNEVTGEDLSLGAPTGLYSKALRDTSKNIKVASLRGMGLREER